MTAPLPETLAMNVPSDVVVYLEGQHAEIKTLFAATLAASAIDRPALFLSLRKLIATHEAMEEELFHPWVQHALGERGREIVLARLTEERAATSIITEIEHLPVDSMQFEMELRKLKLDVVKHAESEEAEEFPVLLGISVDQLQRVREAVQALSTVNLLSEPQGKTVSRDIGPFVAMLNHARDVLAGNRSLEGAVGAVGVQARSVT